MKKEQPKKNKVIRKKSGVVVSDKMDKTIVVEVMMLKTHRKYHKKYRDSKRYKVHDEKNEYKIGDKIFFQQCRPISGGKKWKAVK